MKIMCKNAWYIYTELQYKVSELAMNKGYETYIDKERGNVYFTKRKHAEKIAARIDANLRDKVYHATLEFLMAE